MPADKYLPHGQIVSLDRIHLSLRGAQYIFSQLNTLRHL